MFAFGILGRRIARTAELTPTATALGGCLLEGVELAGKVLGILGLGRVGMDANFFPLGGDSISSIRLVSRARERGLALMPRDVFLHRPPSAFSVGADFSTFGLAQ